MRFHAVKCHINVISIRKKCVYTQKMQIEAGVRGVVGDCKQMSAKRTRQGLLPALILDWLDNCRLLHLYALDGVGFAVAEHENLAVIGFSREQRALWKVFPKSLSCSLPGTNG